MFVSVVIGGMLFLVNYIWYRARKIENRYVEFAKINDYLPQLQELSNDISIPKYSTHLVYLTSANNPRKLSIRLFTLFSIKSLSVQTSIGSFMMTYWMNLTAATIL